MSKLFSFHGKPRARTGVLPPSPTPKIVVQKKVVPTETHKEQEFTKIVVKRGNKNQWNREVIEQKKTEPKSEPKMSQSLPLSHSRKSNESLFAGVEVLSFGKESKSEYESRIKELEEKVKDLENRLFARDLISIKGFNCERKITIKTFMIILRKLDGIKELITKGKFGDAICEINVLSTKINELDYYDHEGIKLIDY